MKRIQNLPLSKLGLGLAALGRPGYINLGHAEDLGRNYDAAAMQTHTQHVLDEAWNSGIRYFDAAQSYGRAEEFLRSWLASRTISADDVVVGTKWGYTYTAAWQVTAERHEVKEHSLPVLRKQWRESKERLSPHLKIFQIHSATFESGVLSNPAVLNELHKIKQEGVFIGLTLSGPRQSDVLTEAARVEVEGHRLFDSVQATWNLLEQSAGPALAAAHDQGLAVIVKEALANGRLTQRNRDPVFKSRMLLLRDAADAVGATVDAVALAAALAQPWADVVLSGAATVDHLRSNITAMRVQWDEALEGRLEPLPEQPEDYWNKRSQLPWN